MNNFGQKIRELREAKHLFLRQLAAALEMDTALISKIERGERNATRLQVLTMAKFLDASEEELLTLWLADKIEATVVNEPEVAYKAMRLATQKLNK
jgi:HTH-type transcriptional regulator, competence development regulator